MCIRLMGDGRPGEVDPRPRSRGGAPVQPHRRRGDTPARAVSGSRGVAAADGRRRLGTRCGQRHDHRRRPAARHGGRADRRQRPRARAGAHQREGPGRHHGHPTAAARVRVEAVTGEIASTLPRFFTPTTGSHAATVSVSPPPIRSGSPRRPPATPSAPRSACRRPRVPTGCWSANPAPMRSASPGCPPAGPPRWCRCCKAPSAAARRSGATATRPRAPPPRSTGRAP